MWTELAYCQDPANPHPSFKGFLGRANTKPGTGIAEPVSATWLGAANPWQVQGPLSVGAGAPLHLIPGLCSPWNSAEQAS